MAKQKKRNDGLYQKNFRFEGKQYIVYGHSIAEVEEKKQNKIKELQTGTEKHNDPTCNQYYEMFQEFRRGKVKESTMRGLAYRYEICSKVVINDNGKTLGETKISKVKPQDIKKVQKELEKSPLSTRSVNDYIAHLSHVFKKAVDDELIGKNPCSSIEKLRCTETPASETNHRALTKEETAEFFSASTDSYYNNFFRLLIQTGLRIGELSALTYTDIDVRNNCIHISKTVTRDEIGGYMIGDSTKTKTGCRDIPMNKTILQIISDQKQQNRDFFGNVQKIDELLFKAPSGEILREYQINREIKRITKRTKMEHFTCHAFRATFATRFIEQRPQDYKVLSEILGHADTKITLNLYTHVMKDTKTKAMDGIEIAM